MKQLPTDQCELIMLIKITKSKNWLMWYNLRVGEEFTVVSEDPDCYWCREGGEWNALNMVYKEDCEIVEE